MKNNPLGLSMEDWYTLKDCILNASNINWKEEVRNKIKNPRFQGNPVCELLEKYFDTGDDRYIDRAAETLTGLKVSDNIWLFLMKA